MNKATINFTFKPAVETQRALIHEWLKQDYIHEWIHGQGLQNTLLGLEKYFQYLAAGHIPDHNTQMTQHWIGYANGKPFVYLLTTNILKNTINEYAKYSTLNGLAMTLDIFIGDPEYLGKGLASMVIKEFLLSQFPEISEIFIDPEKSNTRAIHVYQKTGFSIVGEFIASWHPVPHYIMKLAMKNIER